MSQAEFFRHSIRANDIKKTLGVRRAAGYLRNRGVSLQEALQILIGADCKERA